MEFNVRPIDNRLLSMRVREALIDLIQQNCPEDGSPFHLPNEERLAEMLGVTRASVRDALSYFEQEGYVTRRRGIGTIVNPKVVNCTSRLDLEMDFVSIIQKEGYRAHYDFLGYKFIEDVCPSISSEMRRYLWLEKVFYADDEPVIHCRDWLDVTVLRDAELHASELESTPFFYFLQKYANEDRAYVMSTLDVAIPEERTRQLLTLGEQEPILQMGDTMYTVSHTPICYSDILVRKGILNFKILRRTV